MATEHFDARNRTLVPADLQVTVVQMAQRVLMVVVALAILIALVVQAAQVGILLFIFESQFYFHFLSDFLSYLFQLVLGNILYPYASRKSKRGTFCVDLERILNVSRF